MKFLKHTFILLFLLTLLGGGCILYAFKIEPYRIKTTEHDLIKTEGSSEEITILQFSDLHIKEDYTYKNLSRVIKKLNKLEPDIVLFTGDLYDNYAKYNDDENIISELQTITAKYAKIAIWGNRDYGGGAVRTYEEVMAASGFELLDNQNNLITLSSGKQILFTGIDDFLLGAPALPETAGTDFEQADYKLLLMHEPDGLEEFDVSQYDFILSGHSHGGQINIPFFPAINKAAIDSTLLSTSYSGGMYTLDESANQKLYVNTGLGTTHISARFGVVPEIAVFQLYL